MASRSSQNPAEAVVYDWRDLQNILPQDFVQGLSSNFPPSRAAIQYAEAARVNPTGLLKAAKQRAGELDGQIKKLQAEKDILTDEPRVQATLTTALDLLTSPIRRLPADIIREIIHHAAEDEFPRFNLIGAVMTLSRVCSLWRTVVLSSPRLWSTLYLRVTISHRSVMQCHQIIQAWFGRAGVVPLRLFLYLTHPIHAEPGAEPSYIIKTLLKSLAPWTSRIVHLGIGSRDWAELMVHFAGAKFPLPSLQRLDIAGEVNPMEEEELEDAMATLSAQTDQITLFRDASLMTTLVASQEISIYLQHLSLFPWQQITNLCLDEYLCEASHTFELLKLCPQLRRADLHVDARWNETLSPFVHNTLEMLKIILKTLDCNQVVDFFRPYCFPNLSALEMSLDIGPDPGDPNPNLDSNGSFENSSPFPSLHTWTVYGHTLPTSVVTKFLERSPSLRSLHLEIYEGSTQPICDVNELCRFMTVKPGQKNPLTSLEGCFLNYSSIDFIHRGPIHILDTATVAGFVRSRTEDLPASCNSLKEAVFSGGFRLLTDIEAPPLANVLKISSCPTGGVNRVYRPTTPGFLDLEISSFLRRLQGDWFKFGAWRPTYS